MTRLSVSLAFMKKSFLIKIITAVSLAIFAVCIIILFLQSKGCGESEGYEETVVYPSLQESSSETETTDEDIPYASPIDWEELWQKNTDIYSWLYIPGTEISYPVVQSDTDDTFYLTHDAYKKEYKGGSIMSEHRYTSKTFEDPVTILYGHKMRSGAMLGTLQPTYSDEKSFKEHQEIIIYLPDKELHYRIWATTPYDNSHIMAKYDFTNGRHVQLFINEIKSIRSIEGQLDETMDVNLNDRFLVLSTCLMGKVKNRYLVIARLEAVD